MYARFSEGDGRRKDATRVLIVNTAPRLWQRRFGAEVVATFDPCPVLLSPVQAALSLRISSASIQSARFKLTPRSMLPTGRVCKRRP